MKIGTIKPVFGVLVNILKGGPGKTTTTMMLALAWARRGRNVLVIDADPGTQGVTSWATAYYAANPDGDLGFDIVQWAPKLGLLVKFVKEALETRPDIDLVLIDVGGEAPDVTAQALRFSDLLLLPCEPTQATYDRVTPTLRLVSEVRPDLPVRSLLTKVDSIGRGAALDVRDGLDAAAKAVLDSEPITLETEVENNREKYDKGCWNRNPSNVFTFGRVADELTKVIADIKRKAA